MADDKKIIFSMVGVSKIFPPQKQVLKNIYLSFFYGAKIGIIGLNGSGKSTLLKIIAGIDKEHSGEVVFSPGYSVGYLEQDPKLQAGKTVKEIVQEGVQETVDILKEYEEVNERFGDPEVLEIRIRWMHSSTGRPNCRTRSTLSTPGISIHASNVLWMRCAVRPRSGCRHALRWRTPPRGTLPSVTQAAGRTAAR